MHELKQPNKVYNLDAIFEFNQVSTLTVSIFVETANGEEELVPGFEELWYSINFKFTPPIKGNSKLKSHITDVDIALPGKTGDGKIITLTLGHVVHALAVTMKEKYEIEIVDVKEVKIQ